MKNKKDTFREAIELYKEDAIVEKKKKENKLKIESIQIEEFILDYFSEVKDLFSKKGEHLEYSFDNSDEFILVGSPYLDNGFYFTLVSKDYSKRSPVRIENTGQLAKAIGYFYANCTVDYI